jgi:hypothetical protein
VSEIKFYKPKPIPPDENKQMIRLRWSLRLSVLGWIIYGAFAYAFADIAVIPGAVQSWMVLLGSILIVAGAESNTIATVEAALSKVGTDRFGMWDVSAFAASLIGGICTPLITFSTRQPELADTWWRLVSVRWGPLILGIAGVVDLYGAIAELALARRDYNADMAQWLEEHREWQESHGVLTFRAEPEQEELVFDPSWPKANPDQFLEWAGRQNGARAKLVEKDVTKWAFAKHVQNPSRTTRQRWAKKARSLL